MVYRQIFGSENAETDDLLYECYIPPPGVVTGKPILVGRWGTGKTGYILHNNKELENSLVNHAPESSRSWYLDETGIDRHALFQLDEHCGGNIHALKRILENIWDAEIMRSTIEVLCKLHTYYGSPTGTHWENIKKNNSIKNFRNTIWSLIPSAASVLVGEARASKLSELVDEVGLLSSKNIKADVYKCIDGIPNDKERPIVSIEPIETPNSDLENNTNLAQTLVTCLLNVFIREYQPSSSQNINVQLSIPWHRYVRDDVAQPQKLYPYIARFKWTRSALRNFINQRINYEFKRVRRGFAWKGSQDPWSALFGETIINRNCSNVVEETFDYFIRHSQYRVRDLIRLSREAVEFEAASKNIDVDKILLGTGGIRVTEKSIRASVRETSRRTAIDRIIEAERKFPIARDLSEAMRGLLVPFDLSEVKRRFDHHLASSIDINDAIDVLWSSGIIGIELTPNSDEAFNQLAGSFGSGCISKYRSTTPVMKRFYLFEHNTLDHRVSDIQSTYGVNGKGQHRDIQMKICLHPMMFEYLDARPTNEYPIGS